ncbi:class I SAM-dependent methyltransferase [Diaminobutyricibacter sp. McL0618]|uniref:class I SAM-dependent methyltransferase n=1 Tax=Leifsonia sp. McL0618 TaxID=3415677 RepID=UPI003CF9CEAD
MAGGFEGDVADYYARYRRGYPADVVDALADALALSPVDTIVDLGCGTGQLTLPLARKVGRALGVDPEADMLRHARTAEREAAVTNVQWIRGTADDLESIAAAYDGVGAITLANAIHLVDRARLFAAAKVALRPRRGLAIIANGTPLWLQDTAWSAALRTFVHRRLGVSPTSYCGTDDATRATYRSELTAMGYNVDQVRVTYTDTLTLDQIVGGVFSAMSDRIPERNDRARFAAELGNALAGTDPFLEQVDVRTLIALRH